MKTLIIEDENQAISALKAEIKRNCNELDIVDTAKSIEDGIVKIKQINPELVFLDIQLSDGLGFSILDATKQYRFKVIFTTAYSKYAIKAIKFSALDYLIKPIDGQELKNAVKKAKETSHSEIYYKIENFLYNQELNNQKKKISLHTAKGIHIQELIAITHCNSDNNYTEIHLINGKKLLVSKTLKYFENLLSDFGFERIHNSYIVNLNHIKCFVFKDGGYIVMNDETILPVAQRKRSTFIKRLEEINLH